MLRISSSVAALRPTLALALMLQVLSGCGGGDDRGLTDSQEPVARLEAAYGGADGLRQFFDTHSAAQISAELSKYGIGYEVHEVETKSKIQEAKPQAITDCVKYFPTADRTKWHNFNGEYYYIDSNGRPNKAYADLPPIKAEARQDSCQTSIGQWGDAENPSNDYDGGHLIGSQLGGWGGRANIVPQDANFNRGNWAQLENKMATCGGLATGAMRYSIDVAYPSASALVPSSFTMTITKQSNGAKVTMKFTNVDGGGPNGTADRIRGTDFLAANGCN
ncbi:DNA/RNA non-specific endonuclease [Pelomonas sp. SE-A7]|uniref:DNA/RNA non-specific endonuclease n=1 Tax=Pelomonas sp. SE-A7 TaxID=3054953 RepID=UPI00259CC1CE|nr:DNA/RNA non-specific endonuclease [Pelomonas sp. SE-A7]MDM4765777.1 DNA/RNA non-specific endonuclease [Pelomonas sp. SE-A7]